MRAALCLISTYRLAQKRESRVGSTGDPSSDASAKTGMGRCAWCWSTLSALGHFVEGMPFEEAEIGARKRRGNQDRALTTDSGGFNVPRARLAPAMISTPGHWASRRRQRGPCQPGLPRIVIGHGVFLLEQGYCLLGRAGSLRSRRLLIANASWWVEGIFDGLPCLEPHCLAGRNFNTLPGLWILPVARRPCRHIESAEAGNSYRLSGYEGFENDLYYRLHRFGCHCLG